jgi:hypothetical protein
MPKIHYSRVIEEDPQRLKELEKYHRYTHLFQRVRMLRLLKSEECTNLGEAPRRWATPGVSARGGSEATNRAVFRSS